MATPVGYRQNQNSGLGNEMEGGHIAVMNDALTISCDESGHTGPDLLSEDQRYFAFGSVAVSDDEAWVIIDSAQREYQLQMPELKAAKLARTARGREAMKYILSRIEGRFAVNVHEKLLALCGYIFEYIYEPVFQDDPRLLYEKNLQRFVATFAWAWFRDNQSMSPDAIRQFQAYMRMLDEAAAPLLFRNVDLAAPLDPSSGQHPFELILRFAHGYRERILKDNAKLRRTTPDRGQWVIDLSASALWSHLNHWGRLSRPLDIRCDVSKPLQAIAAEYSGDDRDPSIMRARMLGHPGPLGWKSSGPITFLDSRNSPAIQLADIVAGLTIAMFSGRIDDDSDRKAFGGLLDPAVLRDSIVPDTDVADLDQRQPMVNYMILYDLALRAERNDDPLAGLAELYFAAEISWAKGLAPRQKRQAQAE